MKNMIKKNILLAIVLTSVALPSLAYAQGYTPLEPLPCVSNKTAANPNGLDCSEFGGTGNTMTSVEFKNYVQYMFNLIIALAAAAAVFMIVLGGLQYMTTDSWNDKKEGIKKVENALLGLLLILVSFMILRTIDPRLVAIPTTLVPPLKVPANDGSTNFLGFLDNDIRQLSADLEKLSAESKAAYQKMLADANVTRASLAQDQSDVESLKAIAITTARASQKANGITDSALATTIEQACNDIRDSWKTPQVLAACTAYQTALEKTKMDQAKMNIIVAKGTVDSIVGKCIQAVFDYNVAQSCKTRIDTNVQKYIAAVIGLGVDPLPITEYKVFGQGKIDIGLVRAQCRAGVNPSDHDYGEVLYVLNSYLQKAKTQETKNLLTNEATNLILAWGGTQQKINDDTYKKAYFYSYSTCR